MKGCLYDSKNKLCRPSPSDQIDYRCLKNDRNRCVTNPNPVDPATEAVPLSASLSLKTSGPALVVLEKDMHYLSGPVSFSSYSFNGRTFNFLGDHHYSKSGTCDELYPTICSKKTTSSGQCFDLLDLLKNTFQNAKQQDKHIDFYLELPFRSKLGGENMTELIMKMSSLSAHEHGGYIIDLNYIFKECFTPDKKGCPYSPNVRFHYSDIRQLKSAQTDIISIGIYMATTRLIQCFKYFATVLQIRSMSKFDSSLNLTVPTPIDNYIQLTHILMNKLYNKGQTLRGDKEDISKDIFKAHFDSDDFPTKLHTILDGLLAPNRAYIGSHDDILMVTDMLKGFYSTRGGKKMHKVRAQLMALENDGHGDMATRIYEYLMNRYDNIDRTKMYIQWMRFYNVYENLKKPVSGLKDDPYLTEAMTLLDNADQYLEETVRLVETDSLLMDAYILARMFRTYNDKTHRVSDTVIIYAGDAHIATYEDFFQSVLGAQERFKQRNTTIGSPKTGKSIRCIRGATLDRYFM
jgi:hypothetical protein